MAETRRWWSTPAAIVAAFAVAKLAIHLPLAGRYGIFRDELYFLDCARHLDWGYVDLAPLIALVCRLALALGGSLEVMRAIAALAGAGTVALAVAMTARLGGSRFAQVLAGLAMLIAPGFLAIGSLLTMNVFEPLFWMGCAWILIRIVQGGDPRLWLAFGVLAGGGLENKHSTIFFLAAVAVGILVTPLRRELARGWIWLGVAVALLLFLPNLIWQWQHHFPTLEDLHNVKVTGKNVVLGPLPFILEQIKAMHPVTALVWVPGLVSLLAGRLRRFRVLGVTYLGLLAVFIVLGGKSYYLFPAYPMLFAAGAVAVAQWLERRSVTAGRLWPRTVIATAFVALGAATAPLALPLLSPEGFLAWEKAIGVERHSTEVAHEGPLPQIFGDQFGWEELVAEVARIYQALPTEERATATIFASNYGEAGALNLFGPAYGLPKPICAHQNHFFWGPRDARGDVVIWLQWGRRHLEPMFASVEQAGQHSHPWGMAEENRPIFVCRGLKGTFAGLWPDLKHWN